jgi:small-conductance mechanosensitive channel
MPDFDTGLWHDIATALRGPVLHIAIILIVAIVAMRVATTGIHGAVKRLLDREAVEGTAQDLSAVEIEKRIETIGGLGTAVARAFIAVIAALMIFHELNFDIGPAIAGLGVVGIAVGFGAQSLVRDYFTGALILIENQFSKGDVVTLAGVTGTVEDFSLRRTTLRDLDGVVHTVPNGEIKVASNRTRVWARINLDVTVTYGTDIEKATAVVDGVGRAMAEDPYWSKRVLEAPHVERLEALGEYGATLKILGTVRASDQPAASGELRKRILAAFTMNGIHIPAPQRVVLARDPQLDPFQPGGTASPPDPSPPAS